ncbi:MAG TPA: metal-dependent transcriptional regulator [Proteobacteria bacterium]|nr:metal-dependent transcriptional regulator [Pseudomonadota bacterium]
MSNQEEQEGLTSNMEDYLETILNIQKEQRVARVKDVARQLRVKMPSVTGAMKGLAEKGLVNYERYSFLTLTEAGEKIAREIGERHKTFYNFLTRVLDLDHETAELDACRLEHATSRKTFIRIKDFTDHYQPPGNKTKPS